MHRRRDKAQSFLGRDESFVAKGPSGSRCLVGRSHRATAVAGLEGSCRRTVNVPCSGYEPGDVPVLGALGFAAGPESSPAGLCSVLASSSCRARARSGALSASLQPHALSPGPRSSGQATTIWVPHNPGVDPPPSAITQARRA